MPIRFVCPLCWAVRDEVDDALLGKMIKCNDCHAMSEAKHSPAPKSAAAPIASPPPGESPVFGARAVASAWVDASPDILRAPAAPAVPSPAPPGRERTRPILFSTGDIRRRYEIVDLVFAHGNSGQGALKDASAGQAFQIMVQWLGQAAAELDANAVIHIHVDLRPTGETFEVYAYGTAVRIADTIDEDF